jgi:hypothetical protein
MLGFFVKIFHIIGIVGTYLYLALDLILVDYGLGLLIDLEAVKPHRVTTIRTGC